MMEEQKKDNSLVNKKIDEEYVGRVVGGQVPKGTHAYLREIGEKYDENGERIRVRSVCSKVLENEDIDFDG
jgi:hypothetical protein